MDRRQAVIADSERRTRRTRRRESWDPLPGVAVILAGGNSERMGRDKALLDVGTGQTIVEQTLKLLARSFDEVIVSVGHDGPAAELEQTVGRAVEQAATSDERTDEKRVRFVRDRVPGAGPLAAVEAVLAALTRRTAFFIAVDFPEVSIPLAGILTLALKERSWEGCDGCVPRVDGRLQPAYAIYTKTLLPHVSAALQRGERRLGSLASFPGVHVIDPGEEPWISALRFSGEGRELSRLFMNVNTPEDHDAWRRARVGWDRTEDGARN